MSDRSVFSSCDGSGRVISPSTFFATSTIFSAVSAFSATTATSWTVLATFSAGAGWTSSLTCGGSGASTAIVGFTVLAATPCVGAEECCRDDDAAATTALGSTFLTTLAASVLTSVLAGTFFGMADAASLRGGETGALSAVFICEA